jgi:nitronate monooxygenase
MDGADIIIAQGAEAGGHGGARSTLTLVPAVVDMVASSGRNVPVVAAGGITDGRGLAAALMLGATAH